MHCMNCIYSYCWVQKHIASEFPPLIREVSRRGPCLLTYGKDLQSAARSAVLSPEFRGGSCTRRPAGRNLEHIKQPARLEILDREKQGKGGGLEHIQNAWLFINIFSSTHFSVSPSIVFKARWLKMDRDNLRSTQRHGYYQICPSLWLKVSLECPIHRIMYTFTDPDAHEKNYFQHSQQYQLNNSAVWSQLEQREHVWFNILGMKCKIAFISWCADRL